MDYKRFHAQVISMQNRLKDCLDDKSHAQSRELTAMFQKLEDDVQVRKNAITIRDQLKRIESKLSALDDKVMSHGDVDNFADWVRDNIQAIR